MEESNQQLHLSLNNPQHILKFSNTLKDFIKQAKLSVEIQNSDYVQVDGWKFAGINFGLIAIPSDPVPMHQPGEIVHLFYKEVTYFDKKGNPKSYDKCYMAATLAESIELEKTRCKRYEIRPLYKYKCTVEVRSLATDRVVNFGSAICSTEESIKAHFDEYAIVSMAQTRAIGKAFRNLLGFVMKAAGFETTPAEEVEDEKYTTPPTGAATTVEEQLMLITDLDGLERYWNDNTDSHKDKEFIAAVTKRKQQLAQEQSAKNTNK
jgi:hypothetical protein